MQQLEQFIQSKYKTKQLPCLIAQRNKWSANKPLTGLRVLDATPVFFNTMSKYLPLLEAGADLTVGYSDLIPYSPDAISKCTELGIKTLKLNHANERFDFILDCAAVFRNLESKYGYVELTRSGKEYYENNKKPVYFIDDSEIKLIEVTIGTGDGVHRMLEHLNLIDGSSILLFGFGKVGKGIAYYIKKNGIPLKIIDYPENFIQGYEFVDARNKIDVNKSITQANIIITATGIKNLITKNYDTKLFKGKILANAGAEDEYGSAFINSEVINNKLTCNFILDEPTQMHFLDAIFALHNYGCTELLKNQSYSGIFTPSKTIQDMLMDQTAADGIFNPRNILQTLKI